MRFSTRRHCATSIFKILVPAAAIFILGLSVSFILEKGAQAENANKGKIYYFDKNDAQFIVDQTGQDLNTILSRTFGGEMTRCADHLDATEEIDFYVAATAASLCDNYSLSADNAIQIQRGGYTYLTSNRVFAETDLGQSRQKSGVSNEFGTLGAFHIIAFNQLDATVQVYGNIATEELHAASNNNINHFTVPTLSYIKTIDPSVGLKSFAPTTENNNTSVIVIGSQAESQLGFNVDENGNTWTINRNDNNQGKVNDSLRAKNGIFLDNAWVDKDDQFLSLTSLKTQAVSTSNTLKTYPTTLTYDDDYYFGPKDNDHPELYVHIQDTDGLNVINTTADGLSSAASSALDIIVDGFTAENNGDGTYTNIPATLLLNVDLAGVGESYNQGFGIRICYNDRSDFADGSSTEYQDGRYCLKQTYIHDRFEHHVIINYYDSSSADGLYHGTINAVDPRGTTQFTIAPEATVHTHGTPYQGVIIANDVILGGDSYYLSLNDLQPLSQHEDTCAITVHHYLDGTMTEVAPDETYPATPGTCGETTVDINPSQTALQTYDAISALYVEEDDVISKDDLPVKNITNDVNKTYIIYYSKPYHLTIDHVWAENGAKIKDTDTDPNTYYEDDEYDTSGYILEKSDDYDYSHYDVEPTEDSAMGAFHDRDIHVVYRYYRNKYTLTVNHYWANENGGEAEFIKTDRDPASYNNHQNYFAERYILNQNEYGYASYYVGNGDPINGNFQDKKNKVVNIYYSKQPQICSIAIHHYIVNTTTPVDDDISMTQTCGNIEMTLDISEKALSNGYKFVSGKLESERVLDNYTEEDFPMSITNNFPMKVYTLYYEKVPDDNTDVPNTSAKNNAHLFTATGVTIAFGAILIINRRRQG